MKSKLGIAIFLGWMTQLGLSTLVPAIAIVALRATAMLGGSDGAWADHADDPRSGGWHLIQLCILLASTAAAWLAGYLARGSVATIATALLLLVLVDKAFEQFPAPPSVPVLVEWVLAPCLGIIVGSMAARLMVARTQGN